MRQLAFAMLVAVAVSSCSVDPQTAKLAYVKSGDAYVAEKKYSEAIIQYRNAIQKDARFGEAQVKLAEAYFAAGDNPNGFREYLRAADLLPDQLDVQLKAGSLLLLAGEFEDAKTRALKILEKNPRSADVQILLGNALAGLKDFDGAVKEIEEAIKLDPQSEAAFANLAMVQVARGNKAEAETSLKRAVELAPASVNAHLALANFYWSTEDRRQTEAWLRKAIALDEKNPLSNRAMALFFIATNQATAAEPYLKVAAEAAPAAASRMALGEYYAATSRPEEAIKVFEQVAAGKESPSAAKVRIAALRYERDHDHAVATVNDVLKSEPQNAEALLLKGRIAMREQKLDEALAMAQAAVKAAPRSTEMQYFLGEVLAARSDTEGAIAAFKEAVTLNPRASAAQAQLARLYHAQGQTSTSVQFARDAVKSDPRNVDARVVLARALIAQGDLARAEAELKILLAQQPNVASVQTSMGLLLLSKRDPAGARRHFDRARELDSKSIDSLSGLVALDIAAKNAASARQRVDAALSESPRDPAVLMLAARAYASTGDAAKTEELLRRTIEIDSTNFEAYRMLGSVYFSQQKLDAARAEFDKAASLQPKGVAASTMVGIILEAENRPEEARKRYQEILEKNPDASVAANNLAWMMAESGGDNIDIALQLAQTAKRLMPQRPEVNDTLGWVYYKKGMFPQAISAFRESVGREPNNPVFHYHMGLAYAKNGEAAKARASLEHALKLRQNFDGADDARHTLTTLQ
jgi:putative PEP-CTERM system TPR-repeat lipoprotein